ncbi:MAG: SBBP repeat-containing protein, partial [bacterium]
MKKLLALVVLGMVFGKTIVWAETLSQEREKEIKASLARISIPWIENIGQIENKEALFYAKTFGGTAFVSNQGEITYCLNKGTESAWVIKEQALTPNSLSSTIGIEKSGTNVNYFIGAKENWKTNIPVWNQISLGEAWPGITLALKAQGKNIEKIFVINPRSNPKDIRLCVSGDKGFYINEKGELVLKTDIGEIVFTKPYAYQEIEGKTIEVPVEYTILEPKIPNPESQIYSFKLGAYNQAYPLVIDPLLASTFIGGSDHDQAYSLDIDQNGNIFVVGFTFSVDYPTTPGAYDCLHNGGNDLFISKLNINLSSLLASTFLGGSGYEGGDPSSWVVEVGLGIDKDGNIFVTGRTASSDYPTTPGAYDTSFNGWGYDAFISKLSNDLGTLSASTFIGGGQYDETKALSIDKDGNIFVTGYTGSSDFPTTPGAYDTSFNGEWPDAFVSKLNGSLTSLIASTFLGGSNCDCAYSLAIDNSGCPYVTGYTKSSNFPTTPGAYDTTHNGNYDAFISKLSNDLGTLSASTFIGGENNDVSQKLAIDSMGNLFIVGLTSSFNYPTTYGAYDTSYNGNWDVFISKISNNLFSLLASTFLGGSNGEGSIDWGNAVDLVIDKDNTIVVAGMTSSSDYPTTPEVYDTTFNGGIDVFVSRLDDELSAPLPYQITLSPTSGPIGTIITIQGQDFATNSYISIDFGTHPTITITQSNNLGSFSTTFIVDTQPSCTKTITARDSAGNYAITTFKIEGAFIFVNPSSGSVGDSITIEGYGFSESGLVSIDFGTHLTIATAISCTNGTFSTTFTIDDQPPCTKLITVSDLKETATAIFLLIPSPRITLLNPISGLAGTIVTLAGSGFSPNTQIN